MDKPYDESPNAPATGDDTPVVQHQGVMPR